MVLVTPAARSHVEEAAQVLARAFAEDPVMSTVVGGRATQRSSRLRALCGTIVRGGLRHGVVDLARADGDAVIRGVAVWSAPGHRGGGLLEQLTELPAYLRALGPGGLRRGAALGAALGAARPCVPHWYLGAIGVGAAGGGIGTALLSTRLAAIDRSAEPSPAYLEASTGRSAALYARVGFTSTGEVPGFPPGARPIAMWRPAADAAQLVRQG